MDRFTVSGSRILDSRGRQVILNGLNLVCKDPGKGYLFPLGPEDFQHLARRGVNVLRFGILWSGAEPEPGQYDFSYFQNIRTQLSWAEQAGISVFLDFHQDLYGISFSDGAPAWAELTDGLPHVTGELWSDAYLISPAVNRAIDHFWANTAGIQDRYLQMLASVAGFFRGTPNLLGFDILNEPYPGSPGRQAVAAVSEGLDLENRENLVEALGDMDRYAALARKMEPITAAWEKTVLTPFFRSAAQAIHRQMPHALIFTNPCYFTNLGIPCGLEPVCPGQILAPHGYDLIVDTGLDGLYDPRRVDFIFAAHRETARKLNLPVIVGEWGAFGGRPGNEAACSQMLRILEQNHWSQTYWCWEPGFDRFPEERFLCRGYPARIAGTLLSYHWEQGRFTMDYLAVPGVTEIFLPEPEAKTWALSAGSAQLRGSHLLVTTDSPGPVHIEAG